MHYIDGFVLAVPTANKQAFIDHARTMGAVFIEYGAQRLVECWQTDVPKGKTTDFYGAVDMQEEEEVVFAWVEWPDKATREAAMGRLHTLMETDARFDPNTNPPPFDGKRMIFGGFKSIVARGEPLRGAYVQGFVVPVLPGRQEAYRQMAEDAWTFFEEFGARRVIEAWQDDVPTGQHTDFFRSVKAEPGEGVVFSFIEWPSREVCDEAAARMQADERMKMPPEIPFDGKRMIFGGFTPVVELGG